MSVIAPLARAFGLNWPNSLQTALLLGPGGEFGFVIVSVAIDGPSARAGIAGLVLFITALTMGRFRCLEAWQHWRRD